MVVTMADSPRPGVWALEKSMDNGKTFLLTMRMTALFTNAQFLIFYHSHISSTCGLSIILSFFIFTQSSGTTWTAWQYFASNDGECQRCQKLKKRHFAKNIPFRFFNMHADEPIMMDDTVTCTTAYSKVSPKPVS